MAALLDALFWDVRRRKCVYNFFGLFYVISVDDTGSVSFSWPSMMLWILNIIIMGFCMTKMFVYGDPIIPSKSKESQKFWTYRRQADLLLSKVCIHLILKEIVCCVFLFHITCIFCINE